MATNIGVVEVGIDVQARQAIQQLRRTQQQFHNVGNAAMGTSQSINKLQKSLVAVGAATGAAMYGMIRLGRASFKAAADVSEMDVAMTAVNKSLGLAPGTINTTAKEIRSMGIEMKSAQEMALIFAQGQLDMAKASQVARVAQDLAVLSQSNSTQTARTLAYAIQTGNSRLLKSAGITKYAGEAYASFAASIGKTEAQLTATERQTAVLNMILEEGAKVAGTYEAAMLEPGKVLRSFPRLLNDMQIEFGNVLKEGFGPAIKAAYDLTKQISLLFREGGQLNPMLQDMGEAFGSVMEPLTDFLKRAKDSVKDFNKFGDGVEGAGDALKKFLPIVGSATTALSLFAGRNILKNIPVLGRYAGMLGGPVTSAMAVFIATNEDARAAVVNLFSAAQPAIQALTGVMVELVEALTPLINGFASLVNIITEMPGGAKTLATVLAVLIARKQGLFSAGSQVISVLTKMKAQIVEQIAYQRTLATGVGQSLTGFKAFGAGVAASMRAATVAVRSFVASVAPLLAVTVAITAAFAIYDKVTGAKKAMKERTEEFTRALRENTDAILENNEALEGGAAGQKALEDAILGGGDATDKILQSFGQLGREFELQTFVLMQSAEGFDSYANEVLKATGASERLTDMVLDVVNAYEDNGYVVREVENRIRQYGRANNLAKEEVDALVATLTAQAGALEELQDQTENLNLSDAMRQQMNLMIATGEATEAQIEQAREIAEATVGFENFNDEQQQTAIYLALVNDVLAESILRYEDYKEAAREIVDTGDLLVDTQADIEAAIQKTNEVFYQALVASDNLVEGFGDLESRYKLLKNTIEDPTVEDFIDVMMTAEGTAFDLSRAIYDMNGRINTLMTDVANLDGSTEALIDSMYRLSDQFFDVGFRTLELGGSAMEAQAAQVGLINTFIQSGEAAGYSRDQIMALIDELGILDTLDPSIAISVGLDLSELKAQLASLTAMYVPGVSGFGNALVEQISGVQALIAALEGVPSFSTGAIGGGRPMQVGVVDAVTGGGGTEAVDELTESINNLAGAAYNLGESMMTQDFAEQLFSASPSELIDIFDNVTGQLVSLAQAAEELGKDGSALTTIIDSLRLDFTKLAEAAQEAAEAQKALAEAQDELARREGVLSSLESEYESFARAFGLPFDVGERSPLQQIVDDLNGAIPDLRQAQGELNSLLREQASFRERVQSAFTPTLAPDANVMAQTQRILGQAREFRDNLIALRDRGFPADVIQQVAQAGLQGGARIGRQLLRMSTGEMSEFLAMREEIASLGVETAAIAGEVIFGADIADAQGRVDEMISVVQGLYQEAIAEAQEQVEEQNGVVNDLTEALETATDKMTELVESIQVTLFNAFNNFLANLGADVTALTTTPIPLNFETSVSDELIAIVERLEAAGIDVGGKDLGPRPSPSRPPEPAPQPAPPPPPAERMITVNPGDGGFRLLSRLGVSQTSANMRKLWEHNGLWFRSAAMGEHATIHPGNILRVPAFRKGGYLKANQVALVGEEGPELFAPNRSGMVIPNHAIGGGGGDTYNITINTHAGMRAEDIVREIEKYTRRRGQLSVPTTGTRRF